MQVALRLVIACALLSTLFVSVAGHAQPEYGSPVPSWVVSTPLETKQRAGEPTHDDRRQLVEDIQQHFVAERSERFFREVYRVRDASGVQDGSELQIDYAPQTDRVRIHYVRIHRKGRVVDALDTADKRTLHVESDRDRYMYNGDEQLVLVLEDVRAGDIIEWAYTLTESDPTLGGHVLTSPVLSRSYGVDELSIRVSYPEGRDVRLKIHGDGPVPRRSQTDGRVSYAWHIENSPAHENEGDTPSWFVPYAWAEFTDFSSWKQVGDWALPLYRKSDSLPRELVRHIADWKKLATPEARLLAASRFVQEEVRYLGMEIGPHSLKPHPPAEVFERRFGDCKDKTLLLVTILESLGIDAAPALVSSNEGRRLSEWLPSPLAFDHVIARVTLGAKTYWFDPTDTWARGGLEERAHAPYLNALVVAKGSDRLTPIPLPEVDTPQYAVHERFFLGEAGAPVTLRVTTEMRGEVANHFRGKLRERSPEELGKDYANYYAERYGHVTNQQPLSVSDDSETNLLTLTEVYGMDGFWKDNVGEVRAWAIADDLEPPHIVQRSSPLALPYPRHVLHSIELNWKEQTDFELVDTKLSDDFFVYQIASKKSPDGRQLTLTHDLRFKADSVPASAVEGHLALRDQIDTHLGYEVSAADAVESPTLSATSPATANRNWLWLLAVGGVAAAWLVGDAVRQRLRGRRQRNFRRQLAIGVGEAPGTAHEVASREAAHKHFRRERCACNRPVVPKGDHESEVRFDGRRLLVLNAHCDTCSVDIRRYYACRQLG